MPAKLFDNIAKTAVTFTVATSPSFRADFYDKYGMPCSRELNRLIIQGVSGASAVNISYINSADKTVSVLTGQTLSANNIIQLPSIITAKSLILTFTASGATFSIKQIRAVEALLILSATSTTTLTENSDKGNLTTKSGQFYAWCKYLRPAFKLEVTNGAYSQYQTLKAKEAAAEMVTLIPFQDLDFVCVEGGLTIDDAKLNRWSSLVDYTIKLVAK